jgi:hypothetical protein
MRVEKGTLTARFARDAKFAEKRIIQVFCVVSVSAVKMNIKMAPFREFIKPPLLMVVFD